MVATYNFGSVYIDSVVPLPKPTSGCKYIFY